MVRAALGAAGIRDQNIERKSRIEFRITSRFAAIARCLIFKVGVLDYKSRKNVNRVSLINPVEKISHVCTKNVT